MSTTTNRRHERWANLRHQIIVRNDGWRGSDQGEQQIERELGESNLGGRTRDALARNVDHEVG